ncbi:MAG: hypothetical protein A2W04_06140 [Betaproteobacteria bacterium RBG_16_64_9]|nr:MAG: hypothetical protein A2W04_06140 [Betaproteobacteria bacterium RBG_16_64_9]OGA30294.1 MAG: hypothetical protein A3I01_18400 [Betaproteobacteria bacterium RIFCSPLOWO2_02_FULL_65_24]OGA79143.1 MAG: hypothetical protein A3G27_00245 [Betaproteobacteria bacterium RIFCSPLOWO2_12_FULL_66_14]
MTKVKSAPRRVYRRTRPSWERGYYAHGYWLGKEKLGSVKLGPRPDWDGIYRWQAGHYAGEASTLDEAKRAVEAAVLLGTSQLQLFGD